jgi:hypothetical protein
MSSLRANVYSRVGLQSSAGVVKIGADVVNYFSWDLFQKHCFIFDLTVAIFIGTF